MKRLMRRPRKTPKGMQYVRHYCGNPGRMVLVDPASTTGMPVATCWVDRASRPRRYVMHVMEVDESLQRRGIGTYLLHMAVTCLFNQGAERLVSSLGQ